MSARRDWMQFVTHWNRQGIRWRELRLAELTWLIYSDLVDILSTDPKALRDLFVLTEDKASVAAMDRKAMGQTATIQTDF